MAPQIGLKKCHVLCRKILLLLGQSSSSNVEWVLGIINCPHPNLGHGTHSVRQNWELIIESWLMEVEFNDDNTQRVFQNWWKPIPGRICTLFMSDWWREWIRNHFVGTMMIISDISNLFKSLGIDFFFEAASVLLFLIYFFQLGGKDQDLASSST